MTMEVTVADILESFGTQHVMSECIDFLSSTDFSYEILQNENKEQIILSSLKQIESDKQVIGADIRTEEWENGWKENLDAFRKSGDLGDIVPKFIRPNNVVRFKQEFISPSNKFFERNYCRLFQMWFFKRYMGSFDSIYEFGCGSGFNLATISKMFPDKKIIGTDFVKSSVQLVNEIAKRKNFNIEGHLFDMLNPPSDFRISSNSCAFTFGALEQLAGKFQKFIEYLINQRVKRCMHVEPTIELYDPENIVDYLAIMFHKKRGYSEGLLPHLQKLHNDGVINLVKVHRLKFGNDRMEGYNYLIWENLY